MSTIGSTTAPSTNTIYYDSLLSTTLMKYRKTMQDNIFKSSAFLAALRQYGGIEMVDGGERIAQPLMFEKNDTFRSYKGYEQLSVVPQDGMTTAFYPWTEIGGTITISRLEERQNSGESAILKLLEKKIMQAEMSAKEKVNRQLIEGTLSSNTFVPGNDAKDLLPLGYFLRKLNATDPTTGGNVGNIAGATYSWWRHNTATLDSTTKETGNCFAKNVATFVGLKLALRAMYNWCSRGADGSGPNLIVMDQQLYETYEAALDVNVRYTDTKLADMGFDNIKMKGATCIWDELMPNIEDGYLASDSAYTTSAKQCTAFFLNTKFYKLCIDSQTDFVTTPFVEPENQTAKTAKILFMGQATVSNMRKLGVVYALSSAIVA